MQIPTHIGERTDIGTWPKGFPDDFVYLCETATQWVEVLSPPAFYKFKETPRRFRKNTGSLVGIKQEIEISMNGPDYFDKPLVHGAGVAKVRKLTAKEKKTYVRRHIRKAQSSLRECRRELKKLDGAREIVLSDKSRQTDAAADAKQALRALELGEKP